MSTQVKKRKYLVCFVVSSKCSMLSAGVRIRYERLIKAVDSNEFQIEIKILKELMQQKKFTFDVYVFSKVFSQEALSFGRKVIANNKRLGIDVFDDYFSHYNDGRFSQHQIWLKGILKIADFVFCSTERMKNVIKNYSKAIKIYLLQDILPVFEQKSVHTLLLEKRKNLFVKKSLELVWFGMGDNPYFKMGLSDLVGFSYYLNDLNHTNFDVSLRVLTNERALTINTLQALSALPIRYSLDFWSLENERNVLQDSFLCFLPVNAHNGSITKTLNRATTALLSGCQILSVGFPLYEKLTPFIYRDPCEFIVDLKRNMFKYNEFVIDGLRRKLLKLGDQQQESKSFCQVIPQIIGNA